MKKTTLFRVLTFILMIGLLASCSKHTDKPANTGGGDKNGGGNNGGDNNGGGGQTENYYVKAKMDGTSLNYSGTVKASRYIDEYNRHVLRVQGIKGNGSTDEMEVIILSAEDATVGQYTEGDHDNYAIYGIYAPQNRADDNGIYMAGQQSTDNAAPFNINITEITSKYVKGTFSGAFFDAQGSGSNEKKFANGEFIAPIQ
jgi:hypothetical protein